MIDIINNKPDFYNQATVIFLFEGENNLPDFINEKEYVKNQIEQKKQVIPVFHKTFSYIVIIKKDADSEQCRKKGSELYKTVNSNKQQEISIDASNILKQQVLSFVEGLTLSGYRFDKYLSDEKKEEKKNYLEKTDVFHPETNTSDIDALNNIVKAVFWVRDAVNEPVNYMNATKFANKVQEIGKQVNLNVEVFDKKKIESLRMGGLLAVNKGSIDPPTFTICEWKPENAKNSKPYILVGKGVMYDTGGLSLKPTSGSMDFMKSDMAGAAAVAGTLYALALAQQPVWVIGIMPATDNRPDGNAYTPGDIIKMYNGLSVEVLNTDAEGRLILADALSYADRYNPELVIDMATLTGSAIMAIGKYASVFMGNANDNYFNKLENAGNNTNERLVRFPFWDEYAESLKSNIADLKNIGERYGGAISAGKFLENFTKSPYIHIDIAGPAFVDADDAYIVKGGTGFGVRLLTEFFKNISNTEHKS